MHPSPPTEVFLLTSWHSPALSHLREPCSPQTTLQDKSAPPQCDYEGRRNTAQTYTPAHTPLPWPYMLFLATVFAHAVPCWDSFPLLVQPSKVQLSVLNELNHTSLVASLSAAPPSSTHLHSRQSKQLPPLASFTLALGTYFHHDVTLISTTRLRRSQGPRLGLSHCIAPSQTWYLMKSGTGLGITRALVYIISCNTDINNTRG